MLVGNREHAHTPLIIEAYKSVPAAKVAKLLELLADQINYGLPHTPDALFEKAGIQLAAADKVDLFKKVSTIVDVLNQNEISIHHLSRETFPENDHGFNQVQLVQLADIQRVAAEQLSNETDGAGVAAKQYHTHHPLREVKPGTSYPYTPQPLPEDRALVTVSWPSITHVQVVWGETVKEVRTIEASQHPSGLFFSYDNAAKIQKLLANPRIKETGLVFGYAAAEPVRLLDNGHALKGLAAFFPGDQRTRNIRKVMPTANGPGGGGL